MEPVSLEEHPDYEDFVFKPMDLVKLEHVSTKDYNPILHENVWQYIHVDITFFIII